MLQNVLLSVCNRVHASVRICIVNLCLIIRHNNNAHCLFTALKHFLKNSEHELEKVVNKCCEFSSVVAVAKSHRDAFFDNLDKLRCTSTLLCHDQHESSQNDSAIQSKTILFSSCHCITIATIKVNAKFTLQIPIFTNT